MKQIIEYRALDSKVLAVCVSKFKKFQSYTENSTKSVDNDEELFDWAVYIGAVAGFNHEFEYMKVAETGSKAFIELAKILFPDNDITKYRR